jgi:hypothetical protein
VRFCWRKWIAALRGVSAGSVLDMLPEPVKDRAPGLVELTADQGIITRTNGLGWNRLCARTRVSSGPCGSTLKPVRQSATIRGKPLLSCLL